MTRSLVTSERRQCQDACRSYQIRVQRWVPAGWVFGWLFMNERRFYNMILQTLV